MARSSGVGARSRINIAYDIPVPTTTRSDGRALSILFVGPKGEIDWFKKKSSTVLGRAFVIIQWFQ
jgi:hypothetical protein